MEVCIKDARAVVPSKVYHDDVGYDLTIIDVFKVVSPLVTMYETGIAVKPPAGHYVEIVPRSSLSKSGYVLANSVGIVDPQYRGTLKVALLKVDPNASNIELPFKGFQLIIRKNICDYPVMVVAELDTTLRNFGGFGSTDDKPLSNVFDNAQNLQTPLNIEAGDKVD